MYQSSGKEKESFLVFPSSTKREIKDLVPVPKVSVLERVDCNYLRLILCWVCFVIRLFSPKLSEQVSTTVQ